MLNSLLKRVPRVSLSPARSPIAYRVALGAGLCLASICILAACATTAPVGSIQYTSSTSNSNSNTSSSWQVSATSASSATTNDASDSWRTISESSVSSVSIGGGSNSSDSQSSVSVHGAYQVLAACEGSGSLNLTLRPGGGVTVRCSSDEGDPARVAGSDTPPSGGTLTLDVRPSGTVTDADILIQERR